MITTLNIIVFLFGGIGVVIITGLYKYFAINCYPLWGPDRDRKRKNYIGHYESFHLMTSGENEIIKSYVHLYPNLLGQIRISINSFQYDYIGTLREHTSNLYLFTKGKAHEEYMLWLFNKPLTPKFELITGTLTAITENRTPVAGRIILKKIENKTLPLLINKQDCDELIESFLSYKENPLRAPQPHRSSLEGLKDLNSRHSE